MFWLRNNKIINCLLLSGGLINIGFKLLQLHEAKDNVLSIGNIPNIKPFSASVSL